MQILKREDGSFKNIYLIDDKQIIRDNRLQVINQYEVEGKHANRYFTSWWADAKNQNITELADFTRTFFARHTLLNILTKYCVFDVDRKLLVMRPYQIVAAERILQRIATATNHRQLGTVSAGGYIWHTTGSGKTLTSFKAARRLKAGLIYSFTTNEEEADGLLGEKEFEITRACT